MSTPGVPAVPSLLRLDPDGWTPRPSTSEVPAEGPATGSTAEAGAAAAVAAVATSGASWVWSAEGDREGGGDLKTAIPKAGNAGPPRDSQHRLLIGSDGTSSAKAA